MKIALLDDYQGVALTCADWKGILPGADITVFRDHLADEDALAKRLEGFEVIGIMRERTPFPATLLRRLPKLKLLVTTGHRNDSVDIAAAKAQGVTVCGTPSSAHAAAELTWALVMAAARRIDLETRSFHDGGWQVGLGRDLKGATLGVVGLGRLGSLVAGYGKAFGMTVVAWSQNLTAEKAVAAGATAVSKESLFRDADFISIHLKLSERSRGLVGATEFSLMKPDAWIVNTSRGPIVDEAAMLAALQGKRIGGAALDVFDDEPLPKDHPLRRLGNVVATPHVGYVSRENYATFYRETAENIAAFLAGTPRNVIEP